MEPAQPTRGECSHNYMSNSISQYSYEMKCSLMERWEIDTYQVPLTVSVFGDRLWISYSLVISFHEFITGELLGSSFLNQPPFQFNIITTTCRYSLEVKINKIEQFQVHLHLSVKVQLSQTIKKNVQSKYYKYITSKFSLFTQ